MKKNNVIKRVISLLLLSALTITTLGLTAEASDSNEKSEDPLMTLNEEGYFAENFCRELDMNDSFDWSDQARQFIDSMSDESKAVLDTAETLGDLYEDASLTFYSDGSVRYKYKIQDNVYAAFSENYLFKLFVQPSVEVEYSYKVDKTAGTVTMQESAENSTVLKLDTVNAAFTRDFLAKDECFKVKGEVVEKAEPSVVPEDKSSFPEVTEEGHFAESFCLELNMEDSIEWSSTAKYFYFNLSDQAKSIIDQVNKVGDIYDYASLTVYSDGTIRQSYQMKEEIWDAFAEYWLFAAYIRRTAENVNTYSVDKNQGILTLDDETVITIDEENASLTRELFSAKERFMIPGEVSENSNNKPKCYTVMKDVSYGSDERNTMDVFIPNNLDTTKDNGAFIVIYGGSWQNGNKEDNQELAQQYAEAGYIAVTINMRNCTYDEGTKKTLTNVYDMLNDVQGSVKKLKSLSEENGWNVTQCATKGFSSGANIAMLYAYSRGSNVSYFDTTEILPVRFVADVVGPVDMHDYAWGADEEWPAEDRQIATPEGNGPIYAQLLTGAANKDGELTEEELEECINSMSPTWYVDNFGGIPTVMGYSKRDVIQSPANGRRLKSHLDKQGVQNDLFTFEKSIHSYINDPETAQAYFDKTIEYAEKYFVSETEDNSGENDPVVPTQPAQSVKPTDSDKQVSVQQTSATVSKAKSPKTGDSHDSLSALILMVLSGGVVISLFVTRKKSRAVH